MFLDVPLDFFMAQTKTQKVIKGLLANNELARCLLGGVADPCWSLGPLDTGSPLLFVTRCLRVLVPRSVVRYLRDVVYDVYVVVYCLSIFSGGCT